ncbi:hypothetical protein [Tolypothrix sp. VBCCA 56010]|uniref:hypothetical protein n=1 Tax=Tolypothrix sp. VBCCA 56010 TaxID=3137731 RepID=UPI003D7C4EBE
MYYKDTGQLNVARHMLQVGRADGRCFKPGNPSNALPPQRSGSAKQTKPTYVGF